MSPSDLSKASRSELLDLSRMSLSDLYKTSPSDLPKMFPSIPSVWKDPRRTRLAWKRTRMMLARLATSPALTSASTLAPPPTPTPVLTGSFISKPCPSTADLITTDHINLVRSRKKRFSETYEPFRRCLAAIDQAGRNRTAFRQALKFASQTTNSPPMAQLFHDVCQDRVMKPEIVGKLESIMDNPDPNGYSGPPSRLEHQSTTSKTLAATSTAIAGARLTAARRAFWTYNVLWAIADMIHSTMLGFSRRVKMYLAVVRRVRRSARTTGQQTQIETLTQALIQTTLSENGCDVKESGASVTPARRMIPWEMVWLETDHRKQKLREMLQSSTTG